MPLKEDYDYQIGYNYTWTAPYTVDINNITTQEFREILSDLILAPKLRKILTSYQDR